MSQSLPPLQIFNVIYLTECIKQILQKDYFREQPNSQSIPLIHKGGLYYQDIIKDKRTRIYYRILISLALEASKSKLRFTPPEVWVPLLDMDMQRYNIFIVLLAWLTYDEWRWNNYIQSVETDLNYNLILSEPDAVVTFCNYILGIDRNTVSPDMEKLIKDTVLQEEIHYS